MTMDRPHNIARTEPPDGPSGNRALVYFIADAHLGAQDPSIELPKERDLCDLLDSLHYRASVLYMVGDIFDFWFEYSTVAPHLNFRTLAAISRLAASGTRVVFLGGNHDYWVGDAFAAITGAEVSRGPVVETHFDRRLFIAHGDGLPRGDWGYRVLKTIIRSRPAIRAFSLLHPTIGAALARYASGLSEITDERILTAMPPMKRFLEETLVSGFDAAVVGHVHAPRMWHSDARSAVVVGDWMTNRSVVELSEAGFRLLKWSDGELVPSEPQPSD